MNRLLKYNLDNQKLNMNSNSIITIFSKLITQISNGTDKDKNLLDMHFTHHKLFSPLKLNRNINHRTTIVSSR